MALLTWYPTSKHDLSGIVIEQTQFTNYTLLSTTQIWNWKQYRYNLYTAPVEGRWPVLLQSPNAIQTDSPNETEFRPGQQSVCVSCNRQWLNSITPELPAVYNSSMSDWLLDNVKKIFTRTGFVTSNTARKLRGITRRWRYLCPRHDNHVASTHSWLPH